MRLVGLPPIVTSSCRVLILGSMPSEQALAGRQYYANPRNQFWTIMAHITGMDETASYQKRTRAMLAAGIALWNVIDSCERKGSMDANIRNVCLNPLPEFLRKYPNIRLIFFNGQVPGKLFKRHFPDIRLPQRVLPATSSAYAIPLKDKIRAWELRIQRGFLAF